DYFLPTVIHADLDGVNATGLSPLRYLLRTMRDAFSGLEIRVVEQAAEEDRVYSTLLITGTQHGVFDGKVANAEPVRLLVLDSVHLKEGKVIERDGLFRTF